MKLKTLYRKAIEAGKKADPRGAAAVKEQLKNEKEKFAKLPESEKKYFDEERLTNPYADSRILYGDPDKEIKSMMVGIDLEVGEIVLADRLRRNGKRIDLLLTHHPEGKAFASFYDVMQMHTDIFAKQGVPVNVAEAMTKDRQRQVARNINPVNHFRHVDAVKLLDIPFMSLHTPADNHVASYLQKIFDREKPRLVKDILDRLGKIPEYENAKRNQVGPYVLLGDKNNRAGKVFVDMTGGTEGSKEMFEKFAAAGVGTIITMHLTEGHYKAAKDKKMNVVIAGHISSDTLGLNLILDKVSGREKIEVIEASGFRRVKRK